MLGISLAAGGLTSVKIRTTVVPTYELVHEVCTMLQHWRHPESGPGREETFASTLIEFFPLHDPRELQFLKMQWGSLLLLFKSHMVGFNPEGGACPVRARNC